MLVPCTKDYLACILPGNPFIQIQYQPDPRFEPGVESISRNMRALTEIGGQKMLKICINDYWTADPSVVMSRFKPCALWSSSLFLSFRYIYNIMTSRSSKSREEILLTADLAEKDCIYASLLIKLLKIFVIDIVTELLDSLPLCTLMARYACLISIIKGITIFWFPSSAIYTSLIPLKGVSVQRN